MTETTPLADALTKERRAYSEMKISLEVRAEEAEDSADRLAGVLRLVLPLAKGYVNDNRVGSNEKFIAEAEAELSEYLNTLERKEGL